MNLLYRMVAGVRLILVAALAFIPVLGETASVDPTAAHGKRVLYVYNSTKLENAKAAVPPPADPKRIPTLEKWRSNDLKVISYLESLGFVVMRNNEASPVEATKEPSNNKLNTFFECL